MKVRVDNNKKLKVKVDNNKRWCLVKLKNTSCPELLEDSGPGEVDPIVEGVQFKVFLKILQFFAKCDIQDTRLDIPYEYKGEIPRQLPGDLGLRGGGDGKRDQGDLGDGEETREEAGKG